MSKAKQQAEGVTPKREFQDIKKQPLNDDDLANLGRRLLELRKSHGLNQGEMAKQCGISQGAYSRMEAGLSEPSWRSLRLIAAGLNIQLYELFTHKIEKSKEKGDVHSAIRDLESVIQTLEITIQNCRDNLDRIKSQPVVVAPKAQSNVRRIEL